MTKEEVIIVAVQWWSDKLMSGKPHSNGDNSPASVFACMFADIMAKSISKEQISIFEKELTGILNAEYDTQLFRYGFKSIYIGCDYAPCNLLYTAANKAGINPNNFPYKTHMQIARNSVSVADGYGKPYAMLEA